MTEESPAEQVRYDVLVKELARVRGDLDAERKKTADLTKAGNALSFVAQTAGGNAGRDDDLVAAITGWAQAVGAAPADTTPKTTGGDNG